MAEVSQNRSQTVPDRLLDFEVHRREASSKATARVPRRKAHAAAAKVMRGSQSERVSWWSSIQYRLRGIDDESRSRRSPSESS
jgi:hypothetical protein